MFGIELSNFNIQETELRNLGYNKFCDEVIAIQNWFKTNHRIWLRNELDTIITFTDVGLTFSTKLTLRIRNRIYRTLIYNSQLQAYTTLITHRDRLNLTVPELLDNFLLAALKAAFLCRQRNPTANDTWFPISIRIPDIGYTEFDVYALNQWPEPSQINAVTAESIYGEVVRYENMFQGVRPGDTVRLSSHPNESFVVRTVTPLDNSQEQSVAEETNANAYQADTVHLDFQTHAVAHEPDNQENSENILNYLNLLRTGGRRGGQPQLINRIIRSQDVPEITPNMLLMDEIATVEEYFRPEQAPAIPWYQQEANISRLSSRMQSMLPQLRNQIRTIESDFRDRYKTALDYYIPKIDDIIYYHDDNRSSMEFSCRIIWKDITGYKTINTLNKLIRSIPFDSIQYLIGNHEKKRFRISQKEYRKAIKQIASSYIEQFYRTVPGGRYTRIEESVERPVVTRRPNETATQFVRRRDRSFRVQYYYKPKPITDARHVLRFKRLADANWRAQGFQLNYNETSMEVEIFKDFMGMQFLTHFRVPVNYSVKMKFKFDILQGKWVAVHFDAASKNTSYNWHPHVNGGGDGEYGHWCVGDWISTLRECISADDPEAMEDAIIGCINHYTPSDSYQKLPDLCWDIAWDVRINKWVTKDTIIDFFENEYDYSHDQDDYDDDVEED